MANLQTLGRMALQPAQRRVALRCYTAPRGRTNAAGLDFRVQAIRCTTGLPSLPWVFILIRSERTQSESAPAAPFGETHHLAVHHFGEQCP